MDSKLKDSIQKELKNIQAPESLFEFAYKVPDLVENRGTEKKVKKSGFKKSMYAATVAIACSALFTFGVNMSPSFAGYVEKIPVLAQISEFVQGVDKVADHVMETVAYSATDQNITFTIDHVITDSKRTILLYHATVDKAEENVTLLGMPDYEITDENDQLIEKRENGESHFMSETEFSPRWTVSPGELESDDSAKLVGMMELISQDGTASTPKALNLSFSSFSLINDAGETVKTVDGTWDIHVPLNAEDIASKPIEYGGQPFSLKVGDQHLDLQINFTKVYPTMTEMSMDLVTEINAGIFYDYHLEDENGAVYKHVEDGILTDSGDVLPQFESSYFNKSNTLYLVINKVTTVTRVGDSFKEETFNVNKKIKLNK